MDTCRATLSDPNCSVAANFTTILTSPANAFPSGIPRPLAPDLLIRPFNVPATTATHVRFRVLSNQCTGAPAYNGVTTNDPANLVADCNQPTLLALGETSNPDITTVRAAEFEVFSHGGFAVGSSGGTSGGIGGRRG